MQRFESRRATGCMPPALALSCCCAIKRFDDARVLYEAIIEAKTVPWARLGVARTEVGKGNLHRPRAARWRT